MAIKLRLLISAMLCMAACIAFADEVTKTYQFTSVTWEAVDETGAVVNWISGEEGYAFVTDNGYIRGVQVTGATKANATSPITFKRISEIVFIYNTNQNSGEGTILVKIGDNDERSNKVSRLTSDGRKAEYTTTFQYDTPQDGDVHFAVAVTENSIYIKSISITYISDEVLQDAEFSFEEREYHAVKNGEPFVAPTLQHAEGYDGNVQYSSNNTDVATVDSSTGAVSVIWGGYSYNHGKGGGDGEVQSGRNILYSCCRGYGGKR